MSKPPFNAGHFIQDVIYGATPWGIVDNAFGNPLPRLHLARVDSAAEDLTATVDPNDPNNHEISAITRMFLGLKPDMKARDLQNDRSRFYATEEGKDLKQAGASTGFNTIDENNKYKNTQSVRGDISRSAANIQTLADEEVTYAQLGLKNAGFTRGGKVVTPTEIVQRAQVFKNLKQVQSQLKKLGETPTAGASYEQLQKQLKEATIKNQRETAILEDEIKYGKPDQSGRNLVGGTQEGKMEMDRAKDARRQINQEIEASKSNTRVNEGTLALNQINSRNAQKQQEYTNATDDYRYQDAKVERGLEREYEGLREDARFNAELERVRLQNAADMERYEMMLENDKEARRSESISDLLVSLSMLGGAFMI
jgi:hypothetical protein